MSYDENVNIPLKRVKIGTFETDKTEVLKIVDTNLEFSFESIGIMRALTIRKENVSRYNIVFSEERNYLRLVLNPQAAKMMEGCLPKDETFCFHAKNPRHSCFILEFSTDLDDFTKVILQSFFDGILPADPIDEIVFQPEKTEIISMEVDEEKKNLKKKGSDCENGENIPPSKKKARVEENPQIQTRTLRSRNKSQPVKDYNPGDYISDEEDIPEALRVESETSVSKTPSRFDRFEHYENTIHLLTYRDIIIQMEDYKCLDRRELVSNFVLDFYLQYLYDEVFTEDLRKRVHIYKTHFYTMLATKANFSGWKDNGIKTQRKASEKRYERVKDFDKDVNIFEKDFLVFPCNNNEHYFLAIACYPRLNGAVYAESNEPIVDEEERYRDIKNPTDGKALKASVILVFDSVSTNAGRKTTAMMHIRNFLHSKYQEEYADDFPLDISNVKMTSVKCPQQTNATDCGLFLLEFFEQFFTKNPVTDYRTPINLSSWFDPAIILEKRETIANIIKEKIYAQLEPGQEPPMLPAISFSVESDEVSIQKDEDEASNGNQHNNGNIDENNGNNQDNGNIQDNNNGNIDDNNGNGDNNNEEAFNNNNDFNAVDHNIHQQPPEIEAPVVATISETTVTSTAQDVVPTPPQMSPESSGDALNDSNYKVDVFGTVIIDSD